jgi:hypothetical protein
MTTSLILALAMQLVVATKAGLVNYVQGTTNVKTTQIVAAGAPVVTGPNGYVELLLTPGSYLRMAGNSEVVLDSVDLTSVGVRVNHGVVNIEVVDIDSSYPIQVSTGNLKLLVAEPGIYRFGDGLATIISGNLLNVDRKLTYKKGWQVSFETNYRVRRLSGSELSALDLFSMKRSELIAQANMDLAPVVRDTGFTHSVPYWVFSPAAGLYTYMPFGNRRSPYGYNYRGIQTYVGGGYRNTSGSADNDASRSSGPAGSGGSNSNSGSGGSINSGGQRTLSTPSGERMTPGDYQGSKNPPAPPPPIR